MEAQAAAAFGHGNGGDEDSGSKEDVFIKIGSHGKQDHENDDKTSSSDQKDLSCSKIQDEQLESARVEMGEVREENQRLKMSLSRIMKDYEALRMQFLGIVGKKSPLVGEDAGDEPELQVSLTLGRFPTDKKKDTEKDKSPHRREITDDGQSDTQSLTLGLDCKFEQPPTAKTASSPNRSLTNSLEHEAKEEAGETWRPPAKAMKVMRSGDDEVTQNNPPKKARVCVRARCETATMSDGCQWRKYGQKIAKGNPCPRAYYRCTGSPTCPVRKQVQRCADDMSILITTYEGTHNHPLPVSATAMASTTSAAASMLLSGSSSTSNAAAITTPNSSSSTNIHGLNFYLSGNNSTSKQFYLPNSSISSTSPTHPTITLDLTSNSSTSSSSSSHFSKFSSSFANPVYPFTGQLDFGASRNNNLLSWNNGLLSYAANQAYNRSNPNGNIFQSYMQKNNVSPTAAVSDPISAATKVITADPSFQSALAAALTSIIGNGGGAGGAHGGIGEKLKSRGDQLFQLSSYGHQTTK